MEYATHYPSRSGRGRAPELTFSLRGFALAIGFLVFALLYVSVGIRWHTYRARASLHAQREMESTFKAADYRRAAINPGTTEDAALRAREYRRLAAMHDRVADESRAIKEFYERAW